MTLYSPAIAFKFAKSSLTRENRNPLTIIFLKIEKKIEKKKILKKLKNFFFQIIKFLVFFCKRLAPVFELS